MCVKMLSKSIQLLIAATLLLSDSTGAAKVTSPNKVPKNAILLSRVESLTFHSGKQTTSRRVSPMPQLQCVGPANVCSLYNVDVMRCTNEGADYDAENIQWSCKASLPEEFKLGSTDVICEGYASSEDSYVLKGSCGVEYRLLLTEKGQAKYDTQRQTTSHHGSSQEEGNEFVSTAFMVLFAVVALIILYSLFCATQTPGQGRRPAPIARGGYGGGGNDDDDPPPPYDPYPRNYGTAKKKPAPRASTSSSTRASSSRTQTQQQQQQQGWRPGFWTGTMAGAAAGYLAGNRGNNRTQTQPEIREQPPARGLFGGNAGRNTGPSTGTWWPSSNSPNTQSAPGSSSPPSYSSNTHESTGFGSTRRR